MDPMVDPGQQPPTQNAYVCVKIYIALIIFFTLSYMLLPVKCARPNLDETWRPFFIRRSKASCYWKETQQDTCSSLLEMANTTWTCSDTEKHQCRPNQRKHTGE